MKPLYHAITSRQRHRGFTLLEVLVAIAILTVVTVTLYRFVDTVMRAASFAQKSGDEEAVLGGLRRLVATQLAVLPANLDSTLIGMTVTKGDSRRDAMQIVCPAGNALLTPDAHGLYQVTLGLREQGRGSGHFALGLEREPWADEEEVTQPVGNNPSGASALKTTDVRPGRSAAQLPSDWVRIMDNVSSLEIAYFDARLNGWVDRWTDPRALPNLVRVRLGTVGREQPYEIVEHVPGGGIQRSITIYSNGGAPNFFSPNGTTPPGTGGNNGLPPGVPGRPNFTPPPPPPNFGNPPTLPPGIRPPPGLGNQR